MSGITDEVDVEIKVFAIIVVYQPQRETLAALITALVSQVAHIVVVDNGCDDEVRAVITKGHTAVESGVKVPELTWLKQAQNEGLATGLNVGISWARAADASHFMLFDQDSLPAANMVQTLLAAEQTLLALGIHAAALGPVYADAGTGHIAPILGFERFYTRRKYQPDFDGMIEAGYLITSGQLIAKNALLAIGLMRDDLFIDAIDIEWALRARHRGWRSFAVCAAHMTHQLGDEQFALGQRKIALHSPLRHYYIIRNSLLLICSSEINWRWKCSDLLKTIRRLLLYPLLCPDPAAHIRWMARGLFDGLRGRAGPVKD
jgi:rhamnosyltransferase